MKIIEIPIYQIIRESKIYRIEYQVLTILITFPFISGQHNNWVSENYYSKSGLSRANLKPLYGSWYKIHLFRRPILIQTITTGDIIAQQFVEQRGLKSQFYRTLRLEDLVYVGPSTAIWYRSLKILC
ncbi:unnamed protein product [Rhizophagus irregularis]|nr:unnamed protein product [Rhizophagus irregularis]